MNPFAYVRPSSQRSALDARRADPGSHYVAGGTNILDLMKDDVERPTLLIDINALGLDRIDVRDDGIVLGSMVRMSDVAAHPAVRFHFAAVSSALEETASPQLRNMGTVGGNVLQRTRCAYFRDTAMPCNKRRPGSGCGAIGGENRAHAVLGVSDRCIATHPSDLAVALVAFDARVRVTSGEIERSIPIRSFYTLPAETPHVENVLAPGELVTGVVLPFAPRRWRSTYVKVRDRAQYEFALASAAVAIAIEDGYVRAAELALGGVATTPWHVPDAAAALLGTTASRESVERAATIALAGARGSGQNDFKIELARRTLVRAIQECIA